MARPIENLIGQKFGYLTALHPEKRNGIIEWLCVCECGNKIFVRTSYLKSGRVKSCGCMNWDQQKNDKAMKYKLRQNLRKAALMRNFDGMIINSTKSTRGEGLSAVRGVNWHKGNQMWEARIFVNGENHHLGYYRTLDEAAKARDKAEKKYLAPVIRKYNRIKKKLERLVQEEWDAGKEARIKELKQQLEEWEKRKENVDRSLRSAEDRRKARHNANRDKRREGFNPDLQ